MPPKRANPLAIPDLASQDEILNSTVFILTNKYKGDEYTFKLKDGTTEIPAYFIELQEPDTLKWGNMNLTQPLINFLKQHGNGSQTLIKNTVILGYSSQEVCTFEDRHPFRSNTTTRNIVESWFVHKYGKWGGSVEACCTECRLQIDSWDRKNPAPYTGCRTIEGLFDGACSNCVKKDMANRCSRTATARAAEEAKKKEDAKKELQASERAARAARRG